MSFGYSLGDVIAFAGLIERIIVEVKSYRSAPEHFQRLALELAFLGQVCNQINQLEPMSQGEIAHIQRMRAISMQCLGPLRAFEEKMRKFDSVLGVETWKGGNGNTKSLPQRKLENFRQRLHWSMIEKREVDELRAILASEILAINTLLGAQQWETLRTISSHGEAHSQALLTLMDFTQRAIDDIEQALLGSAAMSAHIQHLIDTNKFNSAEQKNLLNSIQASSAKTRSMTSKTLKATEQQTKMLNGIVKSSKKHITRITSVQRHLQGLIESVTRYCREILELVRSNTGILMNLNTMMAKMETLMANNKLDLPYLRFENPFGVEMPLPFVACEVWDGLHNLITALFTGKPGWNKVLQRQYTITAGRNNRILSSANWGSAVAPGDHIFMSMILQKLGNGHRCPRCRRLLSRSGCQGSLCESCQLWSSNESRTITFSGDDVYDDLPIPPADPEMLHESVWNRTWDPFSENIDQRWRNKRQNKLISAVSQWQNPREKTRTDDESEALYRRVHVSPYQGDIIEGYIAAGKELRLLFFEYVNRDKNAEIDLDSLAQDVEAVVEEFEEMLENDISPVDHVTIRSKRKSRWDKCSQYSREDALKTWLSRTGRILKTVPFGSAVLRSRCEAAGERLLTSTHPVSSHTEAESQPATHSFNIESRPEAQISVGADFLPDIHYPVIAYHKYGQPEARISGKGDTYRWLRDAERSRDANEERSDREHRNMEAKALASILVASIGGREDRRKDRENIAPGNNESREDRVARYAILREERRKARKNMTFAERSEERRANYAIAREKRRKAQESMTPEEQEINTEQRRAHHHAAIQRRERRELQALRNAKEKQDIPQVPTDFTRMDIDS